MGMVGIGISHLSSPFMDCEGGSQTVHPRLKLNFDLWINGDGWDDFLGDFIIDTAPCYAHFTFDVI